MTFQDLNLIAPLQKALTEEGYTTPTPIQQQAIPYVLEGRDLLGCAQTGTGKTAAFALPILQQLHQKQLDGQRTHFIKTLILTPTRELAIQIDESFKSYGRHLGQRSTVIFGGVGQHPQVQALQRGIDILIATPGRLLDLMGQGYVHLQHLQIFVLDEADRMLDMGFVHDVKRVIAKIPARRQTLFFSATMPKEIQHLADSILTNPAKVAVTPPSTTVEIIQQKLYHVAKHDKKPLLHHLLNTELHGQVLVFSRTKHGANKIVADLEKNGFSAAAIHGNKSQTARQAALSDFKDGGVRILVATDIAARGIDIDLLQNVVNYDLPEVPETYVHRIGRTGRAGATGASHSFCDREEAIMLRDIERLIGKKVPVAQHPYLNASPAPAPEPAHVRQPRGGHQNGRRPAAGTSAGSGNNARRPAQSGGPSGNGNRRPAAASGNSGSNSGPRPGSRTQQHTGW